MIDKDESRRIRIEIRNVLLKVWDPIGIKGEPNAQDEYDSYLAGVYGLLAGDAADDDIKEHLRRIVTTRMRLPEDQHSVAETVRALRQIHIPGNEP
ncbi:MAG: hypothetical protein LAP21_25530 [Acidobacteriia bacterium]|nr:hypothetical protein [Terriglobia bacterium]